MPTGCSGKGLKFLSFLAAIPYCEGHGDFIFGSPTRFEETFRFLRR